MPFTGRGRSSGGGGSSTTVPSAPAAAEFLGNGAMGPPVSAPETATRNATPAAAAGYGGGAGHKQPRGHRPAPAAGCPGAAVLARTRAPRSDVSSPSAFFPKPALVHSLLQLLAVACLHAALMLGGWTDSACGLTVSTTVLARARTIYDTWTSMYGLGPNSTQPPTIVAVPTTAVRRGGRVYRRPAVSHAPHLQECVLLAQFHRRLEARSETGQAPLWACPQGVGDASSGTVGAVEEEVFCDRPRPPWVRGADEDNLPLTRRVQRDIWAHQFPRDNCSSPGRKFLLVGWKSHFGHGLGAQLHIMTVALSVAMASGRVLVPQPDTFLRADHNGCGENRKSLSCYFFPMTSPECEAQALKTRASQPPVDPELRHKNPKEQAFSSTPVITIRSRFVWTSFKYEASVATKWGSPWENQLSTFELLGSTIPNYDAKLAQVNWWRSQAIRFMLRWPSGYLCHLINRARHESYGRKVALRVAASEAARKAIERSGLSSDPSASTAATAAEGDGGSGTQSSQQQADAADDGGLRMKASESKLLQRVRFDKLPMEMSPHWRLLQEPYMLRPIVSVHVRQGDKGKEMRVFSFASFMWLAQRLRLHVPDLHYVWLSTEMQSVINETPTYKDWTFFYTSVKRQVGGTAFNSYENSAGLEEIVGTSFVNLVIASECDYFVGVLGSNWNRLINELRLTNGRVGAGYMTLNNNDW